MAFELFDTACNVISNKGVLICIAEKCKRNTPKKILSEECIRREIKI